MTDAYRVTALAYRPQNFETVAGQKHVTQTLRNAIGQSRIPHAFLFSGPRGVGKTSMARILAMALNCEKGPCTDPCGVCQFCVEIRDGHSMDYQEIDGASNRGIDQIRELCSSLAYLSPNQKHRIFVIDEVHMLTIEAFNALLKSLEEPPPKVVFVFCTTEVHKVPITIRSRCQHHHFKAFSTHEIVAHLKGILEKEGRTYEEEGLFFIARSASGSMRDSQSLLDQVLAFSPQQLTSEAARSVLGIPSGEWQLSFLKKLVANDLLGNQQLFQELLLSGSDPRLFLMELVRFLNALVFIKGGVKDADALELLAGDFLTLKELTTSFSERDLFLLQDLVFELLREMKKTSDERVLLGFYLIKLHRYKTLASPEDLLASLGTSGQPSQQAQSEEKPQPAQPIVNAKALTPEKKPTSLQDSGDRFSAQLEKLAEAKTPLKPPQGISEKPKAGSKASDFLGAKPMSQETSAPKDTLSNALDIFGGEIIENNEQEKT